MPYVVPPEKVAFYREHGWVVLEDVVSAAEIQRIKGVADDILLGRLDAGKLRADLGGFLDQVKPGTENIVQIAWPTDITSSLDENEFIQSSRAISDALYGDEAGTWALDMNQFLVKQPHTKTDTPWHQDQSYYIQLPDPRACNLWLALGDVTEEMGCLWFEDSPLDAPIPLRPHRPAGRGGGALQSEGFLERATPTPLRAGSITVHSHLTPHYARGNATDTPRYGYVVQTRPAASVRMARMKGFDHGRCAGNKPRAALAAPPPSRFRVDALAQPLAVGARPRTWGLSLNALAQAHPELTPAYSPWAAAAAEALRATGACYFYHADFTHVTAAAPAPFTNASLAAWTEAERADFAERWRDALEDTIRSPGSGWPAAPFPLTFAALELHDSCAIVKVEDPTGGVAAVRRVFAAAAKHPRLADGGAGAALLARSGYKTPQIVHSTVMRIVAPPSVPDAEFEARWAAVAATWVPVTVTARECAYLVEGVAYQHIPPGSGVLQIFPYAPVE